MDLKSGYPFWAVRNGLMASFPPLSSDQRCDIAIIGAGISGALIADEFSAHGHDVVLLDERDVAWGSTAASTALLQFEIDTHLTDLARMYGEADAVQVYRACIEAVEGLQQLARRVRDVDLVNLSSLYYASRRRDAKPLAEEFALRHKHGMDVEWLDRNRLRQRYGVDAPAALLNRPAAGLDPYRLTSRLLQALSRRGVRIYDRSRVATLQPRSRDVLLTTDEGLQLRASHVIIAAGYSSQQWLPTAVARNRSSYAFVTDPIAPDVLGPLCDTLVWESARPYLYLRSTAEGRLVIGGEDDSIDIAARRDLRIDKKVKRLVHKVQTLFPHLPLQPAYCWAGTFAETDDGLPYFGPHPKGSPRMHFALAYGGNGITYSLLGAGLLRALVERRAHPLRRLFGFER